MTICRPLKIFLADDHDLVVRGLQTYLERVPGWVVCGSAQDGPHAFEEVIRLLPDVVIADLDLPCYGGLELTRKIKEQLPNCEVLVFTGCPDSDDLIRDVIESGAKSFINKGDVLSLVKEAIACLGDHRPFFTKKVSDILLTFTQVKASPKDGRLNEKEQNLVKLLAQGHSNKSVANLKGLSVRSIENMRARVMRKLDIGTFADLVRYAVRNHIISPLERGQTPALSSK